MAFKIKVLKRMVHQDLIDEYSGTDISAPCPHFTEGQEFTVERGRRPAEFCDAAWNDIHKVFLTLRSGGNFAEWMKDPDTAITCCTDGYRMVVFELRRLNDDA